MPPCPSASIIPTSTPRPCDADLLAAAKVKVANSDVYSVQFATFVETFARVMGLPPLDRYFFIDGGALAVENALKAAMDWKVRKNLAAGRGERGTEILHFNGAFHGRSGYTMSLTNTDPRKTDLFAKFPWPRVSNPVSGLFPAGERAPAKCHRKRRMQAEAQIRRFIAQRGRGHRGHHHRTHPGRGRRQSFPRRMAATAAPHYATKTICS